MSEEIELSKEKNLYISTFPLKVVKGDKEIWIFEDGDMVAVMVEEEGVAEYTVNLKTDFDSLWGFIVNVTEMKLRKVEKMREEMEKYEDQED